ncbi:MAG: acetoacetate--CoA ligase [Ignavibacteriaceae bacterium]
MKKPLWKPTKKRIENSNMFAFFRYIEKKTGKQIKSYDDAYKWSVHNIRDFWKSMWELSGLIYSKPYNKILSSEKMPGAEWFLGAKLNFAENLLRFQDDHIAIISSRENKPNVQLTYAELYDKVAKCAEGMKKLGIRKGDRIAGFVPNYPESIIAMLATTSLGATWSSCSPDFGLQGVLDRFGQIKPKILFAIEEYSYNGKIINCRNKIAQITDKIPAIRSVVLIERFYDFKKKTRRKIKSSSNVKNLYFSKLLDNTSAKINFRQLSFNHPVYIMYSSGTTGVPKCIIHGAGGTLLQHYKEHTLHTDLTREDIITYYTTCGWMMWNWLVSSLQIGATIFLYDGSPGYPDLSTMWEKIESEKITVFGTSPKFLTMCEKRKIIPKKRGLSSLKTILSTGSPLSSDNFSWVYKNVKKDVLLASISGGTDIISCFMLGNPTLPVYSEEIQCRGLGMKVESYNPKGKPELDKKGELVCTKAFPSMPVSFWNDKNGTKYKSAYFERYPGVWHHGDFIKITRNGGVTVYGRSDATLNPGGVRIGTAEIYRIVEGMDEIIDSMVIGQKFQNDVRIILFVLLKKNYILDKNLTNKIKTKIKNLATPRHVPAIILKVNDIPRTISGKKVELAVTRLIQGEKIENKDALANPEVLEEFVKIMPLLSN